LYVGQEEWVPVVFVNEEDVKRERDSRNSVHVRMDVEDRLNALLADMRWLNKPDRQRSRRLSLAITSVEQGMHWIGMETGEDQ
jgi:hypothetical protein